MRGLQCIVTREAHDPKYYGVRNAAGESALLYAIKKQLNDTRRDVVQTYHYGEDHSKRTCLWLDGLPLLTSDPADHVAPRIVTLKNGKTAKRWANQSDESGADNTPESPERWRIRSRIKHGLANAFAAQWFDTERLVA